VCKKPTIPEQLRAKQGIRTKAYRTSLAAEIYTGNMEKLEDIERFLTLVK
jgi:hypothetical protein